ncbi:hypothetical protein GGR56DRAFT_657479 [Xylariaceae sp. FL0804]|nr:hypothetical protein GGR56DRAFT_657479 [Xylariaceae sp. FL0804]
MSDYDTEAAPRQDYGHPHSGRHPIPTVQGYRQQRKELDDQQKNEEQAQRGPEDESTPKRAFNSAKAVIKGEDRPKPRHDPYPSANRNYISPQTAAEEDAGDERQGIEGQGDEGMGDGNEQFNDGDAGGKQDDQNQDDKNQDQDQQKSATEAVAGAVNPKEKRKAMKKTKRQGEGRQVTDPVTHLPLTIHDQTEKDLTSAPENEPEPGSNHWSATGPQAASKSTEHLDEEQSKLQKGYNGMQRVFPPPDFEYTRHEMSAVYQKAVYAGLAAIGVSAFVLFVLPMAFTSRSSARLPEESVSWLPRFSTVFSVSLFAGLAAVTTVGMGKWVEKRTNEIFDDETWDAARRQEQAILDNNEELPESTQWLNSLFASIWPLVNPDLFTSLVDQVEDIMQASLPKMIKMVSVDDMAQGSESVRVLGIRWIPTGAAGKSVGSDGELHKDESDEQTDRTNPQKPQDPSSEKDDGGDDKQKSKQEEQEDEAVREGMEAEDGDFVNLELALAYRSQSSGKSLKAKAKNAHMFLKFYLGGGVAVPVWVELRGLILTMRLRLQLTPDPPFISLCTFTFLGQPKATLSCVPLSKHNLSLTDVPLISSFVNSSIDAALAEYVAPKSMTLNLKDMLVGEDFKKDTNCLGVVWVFIKNARDFKQGDGGIGPKDGTSDSYVTVSWGKFGKPVAATRVVTQENEPNWDEYASILVTAEEINADEKLRLQLWDSDKWSADDDLGRVEVDLSQLMKGSETLNRIQDREDRFVGQDQEEKMPGSLSWSVGYFSKTGITQKVLDQQDVDEGIRSQEQLKKQVGETAEHKLREAGKSIDDEEIRQQKAQDYSEKEQAMIIAAPPSRDHASGILSVHIHNITGLEVAKLQKQDKGDGGDDDEEAENTNDMPDGYCTIILNHRKIFKTRTKPKNSKPFFNAGTERFVRDWRDTDVMVSVRDSREGEDDPLIGMVFLPLKRVFAEKSQVVQTYPLVGGVGYGRVRISMVWRSVEIQLPANIRGWDYGTLQIKNKIVPKAGLPEELTQRRLKLRSNLGRAKMYPQDGQWRTKEKEGQDDVFLAVRKRYSSALVIEFRKSALGPDSTAAFAVIWLQELVDEEDTTKTIKVWKGSKEGLHRAESSCDYKGVEEGEQPLGEVELEIRFWRGLSGYHKKFANQAKNGDLRDVMECLDTITDENLDDGGSIDDDSDSDSNSDSDESYGDQNKDKDKAKESEVRRKKLRVHTNDDSTPPSSDNDEGGSEGAGKSSSSMSLSKVKNVLKNPVEGTKSAAAGILAPGHNNPDDGKRGVRDEMRDYKDHHKQMHRKHRGIMQWRQARQAGHIGGKLTRLKGNVSTIFQHSEKETGIETEV